MIIFDGNTMEANMYPLHPEGPLGAELLSLVAPGLGPVVPNGGGLGMDAAMLAAATMPPLEMSGMVDLSGST